MKPFFHKKNQIAIFNGDSLKVLKKLKSNSVDSIVTDAPYGLNSKEPDMAEVLKHWLAGDDYKARGSGFMGKTWDSFVPGPAIYKECLRVLKPGGHMLVFFGSRTYDMGTLAVRLAGFEIRDQIMWVYGSGFPKSMDVSKAIDKAGGLSPVEQGALLKAKRQSAGLTYEHVASLVGCSPMSIKNWEDGRQRKAGGAVEVITPSEEFRQKLADLLGYSDDERRVVGIGAGSKSLYETGHRGIEYANDGTTVAAQKWEGWGTALKPAHEPICVARKPLTGTVAANVLQHGTGALNIDGCRVEGVVTTNPRARGVGNISTSGHAGQADTGLERVSDIGRWPANLIHDGHPDVLKAFPDIKANGSAARFFYCAKTSKSDREVGNDHPTVKPTDLMRYLVRLVTPPGGLVLDPFMGSGSTGKAALLEGHRFIGIDITVEYVKIAVARLSKILNRVKKKTLFK